MISKKVKRISPSGEVTTYESITEAARQTPNTCRELIGRAVHKGVKHQGYSWEFVSQSSNGSPKPAHTPVFLSGMSKSDYVRQWIKETGVIDRTEVVKGVWQANPELFGTKKRAGSVVQNVFNCSIPLSASASAPVKVKQTPFPSSSGVLTEKDLRSMFDIRSIVGKELNTLQKGEFWKDADFVRRFQGKGAYRSVLESPEAQKYRGKAQGQVFWSHPESIARMKLDGVLI